MTYAAIAVAGLVVLVGVFAFVMRDRTSERSVVRAEPQATSRRSLLPLCIALGITALGVGLVLGGGDRSLNPILLLPGLLLLSVPLFSTIGLGRPAHLSGTSSDSGEPQGQPQPDASQPSTNAGPVNLKPSPPTAPERSARNGPHLRNLRVAHLAVSLVTAVLFLIVLTRPLGDSSRQPAVFESGEEGLQQEAARSGLPTGELAPGLANSDDLGLVDTDGRPFSLAQYRGRPVWIVMWATYCEACKLEEPDLVATYQAHAADGLVVVAVDVGEPAEDVRSYARAHRLPYPVAIDQTGAARRAYGAIGTPTHFFVGRDGAIRERAFGRLTREEMATRLSSIHDSARPARSGGP